MPDPAVDLSGIDLSEFSDDPRADLSDFDFTELQGGSEPLDLSGLDLSEFEGGLAPPRDPEQGLSREEMVSAGAGVPVPMGELAEDKYPRKPPQSTWQDLIAPFRPAVEQNIRQAEKMEQAAGKLAPTSPEELESLVTAPSRAAERVIQSEALPRGVAALGENVGGAMEGAGTFLEKISGLAPIGAQVRAAGTGLKEVSEVEPDATREEFFRDLGKDPMGTLAEHSVENLPTLIAMMGSAAVTGSAMAPAFVVEAGAAWNEAQKSGASTEQALASAGITGTANMFLESTGAKRLVDIMGGQQARSFVSRILGAMMAEGTTEGIQEFNQKLSALAVYAGDKGLTGNDLDLLFSPENLRQYGAASVIGAVLGGGVVGAGAIAQPGAEPTPERVEPDRGPIEVPAEPTIEAQQTPQPEAAEPAPVEEAAPPKGKVATPPVSEEIEAPAPAEAVEPTQEPEIEAPEPPRVSPTAPVMEEAPAETPTETAAPTAEPEPTAPEAPAVAEAAPVEPTVEEEAGPPSTTAFAAPPGRETPRSVKEDEDRLGRPAEGGFQFPELVELAGNLGKYPSVKKSLGRALGVFRGTKEGKVELRSDTSEDIDEAAHVLGHEIGHWIDYLPEKTLSRGNILGRIASLKTFLKHSLDDMNLKEVGQETKQLSHRWRPVPEGSDEKFLKYRNSSREIYADTLSALLNDPKMVQEQAPTFWRKFHEYLDRKPEVAESYLEINKRIQAGQQERLEHRAERYLEMIQRGGKLRAQEITERAKSDPNILKSARHAAIRALWDKNARVYKDVRRAEKAGRKIDPHDNPILLTEEIAYETAKAVPYLDRFQEQVVMPMREAGISDEVTGGLLALWRSTTEREAIYNPLGEQGEFAQELMNHLRGKLSEEQQKVFDKSIRKWWNLRRQGPIRRLKESGALSDKLIEKIENNANYVRFFVQHYIDEQIESQGSGYGVAAGSLKEQIGTLQGIGNPLVETAITDIALMRLAGRTKAARSIVDFLQQEFPDEISGSKRGPGGKFLETREPNKGTIFYLDKGRLKGYDVPSDYADALRQGIEWGPLYELWQKVAQRPIREIFVQKNPGFAVWNLKRDMEAFWKNVVRGNPLSSSVKALRYLAKAVPDAWSMVVKGKMSEAALEALEAGAIVQPGAEFYQASEMEDVQALNLLLDRYGLFAEGAAREPAVRKFWRWLGNPVEFSEKLTKMAGWKYLTENAEDLGLSKPEIAAIVRSRVGTPNVMRRGTAFKFTNSVFLFSNVAKEGYRAAGEAFRDDPGNYAMKSIVANIVAPKTILMAAMLGWLGDEMKDVVERIPEHDKRLYHIIPLGLSADGKAVYTRVPQDHLGQTISALTWDLLRGKIKPTDIAQMVDENSPWALGSVHPSVEVARAVGEYVFSGTNPNDYFFGQPVIPRKIWEAGPYSKESLTHFGAWMWNQVGGRLFIEFRASDRSGVVSQLEQALNAPLVGPFLKRFVKVSAYGLEEKGWSKLAEMKKGKARERLIRDRVILEALDEDPDPSPRDLHGAMKELGVAYESISSLKRRLETLRSRASADPYERLLSYATTKEEKAAIEALRGDDE